MGCFFCETVDLSASKCEFNCRQHDKESGSISQWAYSMASFSTRSQRDHVSSSTPEVSNLFSFTTKVVEQVLRQELEWKQESHQACLPHDLSSLSLSLSYIMSSSLLVYTTSTHAYHLPPQKQIPDGSSSCSFLPIPWPSLL